MFPMLLHAQNICLVASSRDLGQTAKREVKFHMTTKWWEIPSANNSDKRFLWPF